MPAEAALSTTSTVLWVFAGILISFILPIAVGALKAAQKPAAENVLTTAGQRIAAFARRYNVARYVKVVLAAAVAAPILVFLLKLEFSIVRDAALAGFAWESLLSKLATGGSTS